MPLTVIVRAAPYARMTFDSTQRVVIGRGAGSDVRLPDASVSLRHATLRAQGSDFIVLDEGSTNGTFIGKVRIAPRTSRIVRSGDLVRVGRIWIELRIDQSPVTRDVAAATRDLALALVSQAMRAQGADFTLKIHVVEGRDQGATLPLAEEGRLYVVGRGPDCALALADSDVSREHVRLARRGSGVLVRDLGTKNGTWIGDARALPYATSASQSVFTCSWTAARRIVLAGRSWRRRPAKGILAWLRWLLALVPRSRAVLVIYADRAAPGGPRAELVDNVFSVGTPPTRWTVSTRRPKALRAALAQVPGCPPVEDQAVSDVP